MQDVHGVVAVLAGGVDVAADVQAVLGDVVAGQASGLACVSRVYTDLAVFLIDPHGVVVRDVFGITFDRLTALVDPPLIDGTIS